MIFLTFLLISALSIITVKKGAFKETIFLYILIAISIVSLLPSLSIPYLYDDFDHIHTLSKAMENNSLLTWLFTPHNEHVIPSLKLLYLICYKFFWIHTQLFHAAVIFIYAGILLLTYKLITRLTSCAMTAFIGTTLFASTVLCDLTIFVPADTHILFCLFFFIAMFLSQFLYNETGKKQWLYLIALTIILNPTTFSLGIISIFFALLFQYLCLPASVQRKSSTKIIAASWLISLIPYIYSFSTIVHTEHYNDLGSSSAFQAMNIPLACLALLRYLGTELPLLLLPHPILSSLFILLVIYSIAAKFREIPWKKILFFIIFGLTITSIIYTFRVSWGEETLSYSRYDVFPSYMLSWVYCLCLYPLFKTKTPLIHTPLAFSIYCLLFLGLSFGGSLRYQHANKVATEMRVTIQLFQIQFRNAFENYFKDNPAEKMVRVKNDPIYFPTPDSLATRKGVKANLTRHTNPFSFYSQNLLPKNLREKIIWTPETDEHFLTYLKTHNTNYQYMYIIHLLKPKKPNTIVEL